MNAKRMMRAENMRYMKIQRVIGLLCGDGGNVLDDIGGVCGLFNVGGVGGITVDGENIIIIRNRIYAFSELQRITINTEGSMAIYGRGGKKLCGSLCINAAAKNIELFALWVRKHSIPVEVVSGKYERIFQWLILTLCVLIIILVRFLKKI